MGKTQTSKKKNKERHNFDYVLLAVVLFLLAFGLMMVYSASSYDASIDYGDSGFYLKKQLLANILGLAAMFFMANFPYRALKKFDIYVVIGTIVLLLLLKVPGLGVTRNGATRWLDLKIGLTLQPAEVAKLAVIIYMASILSKLGKNVRSLKGLAVALIPPTFIALLIYVISKNLSSAIIVMGIAVAMIFVAIPDYKPFVLSAVAVIVVAGILIFIAINGDASDSFRLARVRAWLDPESYSTDKAFQTLQALYAIGSGGIWGKGLGQSLQKRNYLPEPQNDMIFSIICEELGLFGAMAVILLFIVLIWCCMVIANNTVDQFGALLVVGVMAHYAIQVILNVAVVTNTIPNTGITLPFISYGGSSVLFLLIEIGIVLNVSKSVRY